jgi:hypothetical protein
MKKLLFVAVPAGLAVLAIAFLLSGSRERADAYEARLERARLKRDFSERAGAARTVPADRFPEWRDAGLPVAVGLESPPRAKRR